MSATRPGTVELRDEQQALLVERLRAARGKPVDLEELRELGIEHPAVVSYELEAVGVQITRNLDARKQTLALQLPPAPPAREDLVRGTHEEPTVPDAQPARAAIEHAARRALARSSAALATLLERSADAIAHLRERNPDSIAHLRERSADAIAHLRERSSERIAPLLRRRHALLAPLALAAVALVAIAIVLGASGHGPARTSQRAAQLSARARSATHPRAPGRRRTAGAPRGSTGAVASRPPAAGPAEGASQTGRATSSESTSQTGAATPAGSSSASAQSGTQTGSAPTPPGGASGPSVTVAAGQGSPAAAEQLEARGHQLLANGSYAGAIGTLAGALRTSGGSTGRCAQPASGACLTYAYALYDLGRALRLDGRTTAAVRVLDERLLIDNQRPVVEHELSLARERRR